MIIKNKKEAWSFIHKRFAILPLGLSNGDYIWLEWYFVLDDTRSIYRYRAKDYEYSKEKLYYSINFRK